MKQCKVCQSMLIKRVPNHEIGENLVAEKYSCLECGYYILENERISEEDR